MSNNKISRINAEIEKQTAAIIQHKLNDPRLQGGLISITKVSTTSDLKYSKIYVSLLNIENKAEAMKTISNAAGFIRNELKSLMNIRNMPDLSFVLDDSIEYGMKIDRLLKGVIKND